MGGDWADPKKKSGLEVWADASPFPWATVSSLSGEMRSSSSACVTVKHQCVKPASFFTAAQGSNLFRESQVLQSTEDLLLCTVAPKLPNSRDLLTGGRIASLT